MELNLMKENAKEKEINLLIFIAGPGQSWDILVAENRATATIH